MPKEKRKKVTGNSKRHAPLGQVIADDENRSKYATVRSRSRASKGDEEYDHYEDEQDGTLLDEKSSRKIFELGREQLIEIEMEEQKNEIERREKKKKEMNARRKGGSGGDSSDEDEDEMEGVSIVGDFADDE